MYARAAAWVPDVCARLVSASCIVRGRALALLQAHAKGLRTYRAAFADQLMADLAMLIAPHLVAMYKSERGRFILQAW